MNPNEKEIIHVADIPGTGVMMMMNILLNPNRQK